MLSDKELFERYQVLVEDLGATHEELIAVYRYEVRSERRRKIRGFYLDNWEEGDAPYVPSKEDLWDMLWD